MNIIFSTYEAKEIGGSYLRSLSLAEGLVKLGHEVVLWTSAKKISLWPRFSLENGVVVIESIGVLPHRFRKGGYDPFDVFFRCMVILFSKCQIIHSFNHRPASTIPALVRKIIVPKTKWFLDWADLWGKGGIADRRNGFFSLITKNVDHYMEQLFIRLPDSVTPISDDLKRKAQQIRGKNRQIFFLGVGANIDDIRPESMKMARIKLKLPAKSKILAYLYVGTYDEKLLAKTFIELKKIRKDVILMLLGPNLPAFEEIIKNNKKTSESVLRFGTINRNMLSLYLSACDLMFLPFAKKEINLGKFPNKMGDYLAAGRPIVANPTGEVEKILKREKVGELFVENPRKFAEGISELLDNQKLMDELGKNARSLAEKLSWLSVAKQLEGFYLK